MERSLLFVESAAETHQTLLELYGVADPLYSTYRFWFQRFNSSDDINVKQVRRQ